MNSFAGVDLGSRTTEIIELADGIIRHSEIFETGHDPLPLVKESLKRFENSLFVATGYGRHLISENFGAHRVTEIKACAKGSHFLFPSCRTVLDMGGQDSKLIYMDEKGTVMDFEMNDRCAAGTGKFLELMAQTFSMDIQTFIQTAQEATEYVSISSMCTVFAESEVISLITSGIPKEKIGCLFRQLLLLNRNPHKLLYPDPSSKKHGKPPKNYFQCREDFPKAELFFYQSSLHCRCPGFIPEF